MKSGFIALVGRPNAGKSTLINALIKSKIAIISNKAQTTRNQIRGIRTDENSQLIFIDTPGIHKPHHELGSMMNKEAFNAAKGVDLIYLIVDVSAEFGKGDEFILEAIKRYKVPTFLILNKIDLINKENLFKIITEYNSKHDFAEIIPISAYTNENLDDLIETSKKYMEDGIKYYPDDQICDYPEQFIISEIIREKILELTEEEIPHSVAVVIERMGRKKGKLLINAMILVERDSQKGIIIGKAGSMIKKVGISARSDIEGILGENIYLELFVRVEKDWRNRKSKLQQLGFIQIDVEE
ncbi:MAG: GTPase Era [Erysipelotrichaceae bacterium]|nr:GTPase Era [Erysipelotrichaceae bacterium]